jgi:Sulfotransferase family
MEPAGTVTSRRFAPVFVVGSPRSGTTLLYDTLLSAGGFAIYLGESNIFNLLAPRFGDLRVRKNRERMFNVWLGSRLFRVSGLERRQIEEQVHDCRNAGDFLRIVMDELARQQKAWRWAGNAPEEVLHLRQIKETIPEALIIHVIRDGRDVSLSLSEKRYIRPFPWKDRETPEGAALYWEWIVQKGRTAGAMLGQDYTEVRFEELVRDPRAVLGRLSSFLDQNLDYDRIQRTAIGTVARPNTSFSAQQQRGFNPVARWKQQLTPDRLTRIEGLVGRTLSELGYELATPGRAACNRAQLAWNRLLYRGFFDLKFHSKQNRVLRALRPPLTSEQVDQIVVVDDRAPKRTESVPHDPTLSSRSLSSASPVQVAAPRS